MLIACCRLIVHRVSLQWPATDVTEHDNVKPTAPISTVNTPVVNSLVVHYYRHIPHYIVNSLVVHNYRHIELHKVNSLVMHYYRHI